MGVAYELIKVGSIPSDTIGRRTWFIVPHIVCMRLVYGPCFVERERERERERELRADCFTLIVSLISFGCLCRVSLPRGAMGWPAECGCGYSWPCSLAFCHIALTSTINQI